MAGIQAEHCDMYGADKLLRAAPCDTTPRAEFEYVMGRRECPPQNLLNSQGEPTRRIRPIDELLQDRLSVKAGLRREEIVALVRFSTVSTHEFRCLFLALSLFLRSLLPRPLPFLSLYLYLSQSFPIFVSLSLYFALALALPGFPCLSHRVSLIHMIHMLTSLRTSVLFGVRLDPPTCSAPTCSGWPADRGAGGRRGGGALQVLYTGPLHALYNTMLRMRPAALHRAFESNGNLFPSTIHAVASAVAKIAQAPHAPLPPPGSSGSRGASSHAAAARKAGPLSRGPRRRRRAVPRRISHPSALSARAAPEQCVRSPVR